MRLVQRRVKVYECVESLSIHSGSFGVMLSQNSSVLSQKSLLLEVDDGHLSEFLVLLGGAILFLDSALGLINGESILPETFDFSLVVLLAHASFLSVHLLETLILGELLHELVLEFILKSLLFGSALGLKTGLEFLGSLELFTNSVLSGNISTLLSEGSLFLLLNVQFVSEVLLQF